MIGSLRIVAGVTGVALLVASARAADADRSSRIRRYAAVVVAWLLAPMSVLMGVGMMTVFQLRVPETFTETITFNDGRNAISLPDSRWTMSDTPNGKALRHQIAPPMQIECSSAALPAARRADFSRSLEDNMRAALGVREFQARVDGDQLVGFSYRRLDEQGRWCAFSGRIFYGDDYAVEVLVQTHNDAGSLLVTRTFDRYVAVVVPRILASAR
ncbi:MAG: hypothetical protein H0W72_02500 [Planctomycetes bacterium]|nr:hypothetical protein [Planctomycetota bacterium]